MLPRAMAGGGHFHRWDHHVAAATRHLVLPDGCRDVLIIRATTGRPRVTLTDLDHRPRQIMLAAGIEITGFRLRPGASLSPVLLAAIAARPDRAATLIGDAGGAPGPVDEIIAALSDAAAAPAAPAAAARTLGVSLRTMERRLRAGGLPPPEFWRLLARARRACDHLHRAEPLAEIAAVCGYSDQAHLSRELQRWFGLAPAALRRDSARLGLARQPALGNWTDEQISTR